jgi:hypothetical protein
MESRLIAYAPTKQREAYLVDNIKYLEDFLPDSLFISAFTHYLIQKDECVKANINMNGDFENINCLELYNANLEYYYNKI